MDVNKEDPFLIFITASLGTSSSVCDLAPSVLQFMLWKTWSLAAPGFKGQESCYAVSIHISEEQIYQTQPGRAANALGWGVGATGEGEV
jgi:hypothetical protein